MRRELSLKSTLHSAKSNSAASYLLARQFTAQDRHSQAVENLERAKGLEPSTPTLARLSSLVPISNHEKSSGLPTL